jgi:uncharacterized protein (TIGR04255 family)
VSDQPYRRPPITEAVIEARFAAELSPTQVEKASSKLSSLYPSDQPIMNFGVALGVPQVLTEEVTTQVNKRDVGHRRSTLDMSEIALIWPSAFIVSQLAPYPGWDTFFARFVRDWKVLKRSSVFTKLIQIGVRYINRIDVPIENEIIEESEFLNVYPTTPAKFGVLRGYGVQARLYLGDIDCTLHINSSAVPSPLIGHGSFLLDIDIFRTNNPPQNDREIFELLNGIRVKKNETFEACITNRARELFQK